MNAMISQRHVGIGRCSIRLTKFRLSFKKRGS